MQKQRMRKPQRPPTVAVVQLAGGIVAGLGLYLLTGLAWALLVWGVVIVAVSTLAEMKGGATNGTRATADNE